MTKRSKMTPAVADVRRLVRECLENHDAETNDLILVACSGGADSLALAAALAFEGPKLGVRIGAVIIDHGIQPETAKVAKETSKQLAELGIPLVEIVTVQVGSEGGLEAAARVARYEAIDEVAAAHDAKFVLLGHTLGDQAETVLLGLARGSGARSLSGMAELTGRYLRPLLSVTRRETVEVCEATDLTFWDDPHNRDDRFSRVRVRENVLPILEKELGPGIAESLARTADQLREDADALDQLAESAYQEIGRAASSSIELSIDGLSKLPEAIRYRVIRIAGTALDGHFHRSHVLEIDRLLTNWHGQKPLTVPGVRVERTGENLVLKSTKTLKPGAC